LSIQIKKNKAIAYFERVLIYHGEEDDYKDKFIQLVQLVNTNEEWKIVDDTVTFEKDYMIQYLKDGRGWEFPKAFYKE
jgi:hypothetical protein